jgi:hypothetical protein
MKYLKDHLLFKHCSHFVSLLHYFSLFELAVTALVIMDLLLPLSSFLEEFLMDFEGVLVTIEGSLHDLLNARFVVIDNHAIPIRREAMIKECLDCDPVCQSLRGRGLVMT